VADSPPGHAAARCVTETGTIVRREGPKTRWQIVDRGGDLPAGQMLLGLPGAVLEPAGGAVRLGFLADLGELSPYPIHESAVVLNDEPGPDLTVTLDRGRIDLTNHKRTGAAHVRLHVRDATWDMALEEPGTRVALELYGRWPRGVPFTRHPGPKDVPTADLTILVLHGQMALKHAGHEYAMHAPPGPALIEWDSVNGLDTAPRRLDRLPPWATDDDSPLVRAKKARLERFRRTMLAQSPGAAIDELLRSDDPGDRRAAVFIMGALDDLPRLGKALGEAKHLDVWDNGVLALRHWIGRGPGQDQRLYRGLIESGGFSPVDAEAVLQLLHSFGDADLARPETYEVLIDYLSHDRLALRGLAYWHLIRLVPAGKEFGYNPLDPKEAREAAVRKWKQLIPAGQLPPRSKANGGRPAGSKAPD
jgi:hypothetical protein